MTRRKAAVLICIFLFIAFCFYLYPNILSLDDYHPKSVETLQDNISEPDSTGEASPEQEQKPQPQENAPPQKKGYHLHINLDQCMMYVYKDGNLLKTYPVSGGKKSTPSPTGNWRIISKDTWGEGFGGAWLGFNVPCPT